MIYYFCANTRKRGSEQGERGREKDLYILDTAKTNVSEHFLLFCLKTVCFRMSLQSGQS